MYVLLQPGILVLRRLPVGQSIFYGVLSYQQFDWDINNKSWMVSYAVSKGHNAFIADINAIRYSQSVDWF